MSRLTKKISKTIQNKYSLGSYLTYDFANGDDTNKLLNQLGQLEDFMESFELENVGQLKIWAEWFTFLQRVMKENSIENIADLQSYFKENNNLKTKWNKLKVSVFDRLEFLDSVLETEKNEYARRNRILINDIYDEIQELEKEN